MSTNFESNMGLGTGDKINYETLYWTELEENIKLTEEIEQLKWKIHLLENKIKRLEYKQ